MRKRMVHPELCRSRKVASDPFPTAFTWIGLWMYLDDFGRGTDDPDLVKADVYPHRAYPTRKVAGDLDRFVADGRVCRYTVAGHRLIHVPSWEEWQGAFHVSHRARSKLPPCPKHEPAQFSAWFRDDDSGTEKFRRLPKSSEDSATPLTSTDTAEVRKSSEVFSHKVVEVNRREGSSSGSEGACQHDSDPDLCMICRRSLARSS